MIPILSYHCREVNAADENCKPAYSFPQNIWIHPSLHLPPSYVINSVPVLGIQERHCFNRYLLESKICFLKLRTTEESRMSSSVYVVVFIFSFSFFFAKNRKEKCVSGRTGTVDLEDYEL